MNVDCSKPRWRRVTVVTAAAALLLFAAGAVRAHDFWIEPSTFAPAVGEEVWLRLRVGESFAGDPVPRNPKRIVRFQAVGPTSSIAVAGDAGDEPAGTVRLADAGTWIVAYRSNHAYVELEPAKFEEYLRLEGLQGPLAERQRRGEQGSKSRELYSRNAKTLLRAGDRGGPDRALGLELELVVEGDPWSLAASERLPVQLLYRNRPLAGALVVAVPQSDPARAQSARSDRDGRVRFELAADGPWLIKTVHMVRWEGDDRAEWESLWASLTFAGSQKRHDNR
jgi:uncharacterized GH25 family protein